MRKKILSAAIAGLMAVNTVPQVLADTSEVSDPKEYLVDIGQYFNADTLMHGAVKQDGAVTAEGDRLNDSFYNSGYNMNIREQTLSAYGDTTVLNVPKTKFELKENGRYSVTNLSETIPFKMTPEMLKGDGEFENGEGKDALVIRQTALTDVQEYTVSLLQKPTDTLYMLYWVPQNSANLTLKQKITYTDGSEDILTYQGLEMSLNDKSSALEYYAGRYGWWLSRVTGTYTDSDGVLRADAPSTCGMALDMYALPVDSGKIPYSITFYSYPTDLTNSIGFQQMLYGLTQSAVSNEDMLKTIDKVSAFTDVNFDNAKEVIKANNYADELIARNASDETKLENIRSLRAKAEAVADYGYVPLDLSSYQNKDLMGKFGQNVSADWSFYDNQIPGEYWHSFLGDMDELKVIENNGAYSYEQTGNKIPFRVDSAAVNAGVKDSIYLAKGESVTLNADTINADNFADSLYMLCYSKSDLTAEVTYTDNTSEVNAYKLSLERQPCAELLNNEAFAGIWTSDAGVNKLGSMVIKANADKTQTVKGNGVPLAHVFKLKLNSAKKVSSIKLTAVSDSLSVFALTQNVISNAQMKAETDKLASISSVNGENAEQVKQGIAYAYELLARNAVDKADIAHVLSLEEDMEWINGYTDPTERFVDIDFDSDMFVTEGDRLNDSFFYTGRNVSKSNQNIVGDKWYINKAVIKDNGDGTYTKQESDEKIAFKIRENMFRGAGEFDDGSALDAVSVVKEAKTIELSGKTDKNIYLNVFSNETQEIAAVLNYTDGTSTELIHTILHNGGNDLKNSFNNKYYAGSTNNSWPNRYTNENGTAVYWSAVTMSYNMYCLPTDNTKQLKSITFKPANKDYLILGITEIPVSNAEMTEYIGNLKIEKVTLDNYKQVLTANSYADELVERHAFKESEFTQLRELKKDALFFSEIKDSSAYTWDLSSYFDIDTIAVNGEELDDSFVELTDKNNLCGNLVANSLVNGIYTADEMRIAEKADSTVEFEKTGSVIPFAIGEASLHAKAKDAKYFINGETTVFDASVCKAAERAKKMYILMYPNTYGNLTMRINYADGTFENKVIPVKKGRVASDVKNYEYYAGFWYIGGYLRIDNQNGIAKEIPGEPSIVYYGVDLDTSKVLESVSMSYNPSWGADGMTVYAVTTIPMSNKELSDGIEAARQLVAEDNYGIAGYVGEESVETANNAAAYADELVKRHAALASDYEDILKIQEQANLQLPITVDISDKLDSDLIVTDGDTAKASRDTNLYEASNIPENGIITLIPPNNEEYNNEEAGRKFVLSGFSAGQNDSVKLTNNGTEIALGNKVYKKISLAADSANSTSLKLVINYADGTQENILTPVYDNDFYSTPQINAHYSIGKAEYTEGAYVKASGNNNIVSSIAEPSYMKEIKSITIANTSSYDIYLMAVTAVPYTNKELIDKWDEMEMILVNDEVTADNAETVYNGTKSAMEMFARHYPSDEETSDRIANLNKSASALLNMPEASVIVFNTPEIVIENNTVTAKVTGKNTTSADQKFVVMIAAYNDKGSLISMVKGNDEILSAGTESMESTPVSMNTADGAVTYKVLVWDSLNTIKPLAYAVK